MREQRDEDAALNSNTHAVDGASAGSGAWSATHLWRGCSPRRLASALFLLALINLASTSLVRIHLGPLALAIVEADNVGDSRQKQSALQR